MFSSSPSDDRFELVLVLNLYPLKVVVLLSDGDFCDT